MSSTSDTDITFGQVLEETMIDIFPDKSKEFLLQRWSGWLGVTAGSIIQWWINAKIPRADILLALYTKIIELSSDEQHPDALVRTKARDKLLSILDRRSVEISRLGERMMPSPGIYMTDSFPLANVLTRLARFPTPLRLAWLRAACIDLNQLKETGVSALLK